jgi:hypothetical protein
VRVTLVRAGRVSFNYYVSSENRFDGLVFLVDNADRPINASDAALPLVSNTVQLANFSVALSEGVHTLTWKYFKDFLSAEGDDQAYIQNLEILGTAFADDACVPCPAGTFANGRQQSRCTPCAANTFASARGSRFCMPCDPDTEFSRPGAHMCLDRPPCVAADYRVTRALCAVDATAPEGRSRRETFQWLEPKLCNSIVNTSVQLPQPRAVPCLPCQPGFARTASVLACTACAGGTAGGGATNAPCTTCGNGEAAQRRLRVEPALNVWPAGMRTSCSGACATNGWRLTDAAIDSGVGHGADARPVLTWDVDVPSLSPQPFVEFLTTIDCGGFFLFGTDACELQFTITGGDVVHPTTTITTFAFQRRTRVDFIAPGRRTLTWTFSKRVSNLDSAQQRYFASLTNVTLVGATLGGAPACLKCPAGSIAQTGADSCTQCPAGTGANAELTACEQCAGGQVAPVAGRGCRPCGPGTRRITPTSCDDGGCQFRDGAAQYDFRPRQQSWPTELAIGSAKYELFLCGGNRSSSFVSECRDEKGVPLDTLACQVRANVSVSLGRDVGFYAFRRAANATENDGVTVRYTGGRACPEAGGVERSVNITLLCDIDEHRGAITACRGGAQPRRCEFCFEWRTQYGCPVCGASDREQVYSECRLGVRRAFWKWKNGRKCWGGSLPAPSNVPCQQSLSCPAGQRLPPGATECLACPNGTFSLGTGTEYFSFDQTLDVFAPTPTVNRWTVRGASMHSGDGTSEMTLTSTFVQAGSISFGYVMLGAAGTLTVLINGEPVLSTRGRAGPSRFSRDIAKGDATITWRFENGNSTLLELPQMQKAIVFDVRTLGTEFASPDCDACPRGTVSADGNTQCRLCWNNTIATDAAGEPVDSGATTCTPCKANEFAYAGTNVCVPRDASCDTEGVHYDAYYTPCVGGRRTKYYQLLRRCADTTLFDALKNSTETCAPGRLCRDAEFLNETSGACVPIPAGHTPVRARRYLSVAGEHDSSPLVPVNVRSRDAVDSSLRFITGCVAVNHARAVCAGGWRLRGPFAADSGDQGDDWVDSLLVIRAGNDTFAVGDAPGSLAFDATFVDPGAPAGQLESTAALTALYVYYGDELLATVTTRGRYEVPLEPRPLAAQNITFRYHQWALPNRTRSCQIANVTILSTVGVATGSRLCPDAYTPARAEGLCVPCPPGTSSMRGGACEACFGNRFAPTPGSACLPCGVGARAARPATRCFTDCAFNFFNSQKKNRTYDLRELFGNGTESSVTVAGHADSVFELSPCAASADCGAEKNVFVVEKLRADAKKCIVGGSHVNFTLARDGDEGFNLDYTRFGVSTDECESGKRVTRLSFICEPDGGGWAKPQFIEAIGRNGEPDRCTATFVWVSPFGCPECVDDDYTYETTECFNGFRNASLVRTTPLKCRGAALIVDEALARGLPAFAGMKLGVVACAGEYEFPLWLLVVAAVVIGCILITIFFIEIRNRSIRAAFKKLREQQFQE